MTTKISVQNIIQKLTHIWSSKRNSLIPVRISYHVRTERGCKIYQLSHIEELP